jgi:hypothetical protein
MVMRKRARMLARFDVHTSRKPEMFNEKASTKHVEQKAKWFTYFLQWPHHGA